MKELILEKFNDFVNFKKLIINWSTNWDGKIGVREGLGCLLLLVAGTKLYISNLYKILFKIEERCSIWYPLYIEFA